MILTEEQVREIFDRQIAAMKPFLKDGALAENEKGELPEPWVGYAQSWRQRRQLAPHIVNGEFPEHLFMDRAPNQTEAELEWLRKNFKQTTLPVFLDLENTVGRAIHPRNWSIDFSDDVMSEDVREYVDMGVREWGSVYNFMRFAGLRIKMQDAMGVIVVAPTNIAVFEGEDGTQIIDQEAEVSPDIHYFTCDQLWGYEYDKWYLLRLNANSWIDDGRYKQGRQVGVLCWLVDGENIWRIEQYGKPSEWTFNISLEYQHGIGEAPCINLMGTPAVKHGRLVWESPYLAAKDLLDIALVEEHYLRASKAGICYPVQVMVGDPCDFVDEEHGASCINGWIEYFEGEKKIKNACKACNNTGQKGRLSPFGRLVINKDPNNIGADTTNATNALAYVSPDTSSLEFIRKEVDSYEAAARKILHLNAEAPMDGGDAKTATEAGLNNRAKDAFVKTIADQLFLIHGHIVKWMGKMRHGSTWDGFALRRPSNYDMRNDADHLEEIANAKEKGLSPWRIEILEQEYDLSRYADAEESLEMLEVISMADRLKNMTMQVIQAEAATGRVKPWEITLHYSAIPIWKSLQADRSFMAMTTQKKVERLIEAAKTWGEEKKKVGALSKLAATTGGATKELPQGEPVQDTALNGAQVTSLVEIVANISNGQISKETGEAMIRAAFPAMEQALIDQMLKGITVLKTSFAPKASEPFAAEL